MDNQSFTEFSEIAQQRYTYLVIHEVIFTIFCLVGICLNITIINAVYGFSRLRTPPNMFFANWVIVDILSLLINPTAYNIIGGLSRFMGYLPLIDRIGVIIHSAEILCVAIIAIDWFLEGSFTRASQNFRKWYRYVIGSVWAFAIITTATALTYCRRRWNCQMEGIELVVTYLGLALIVLIVQCWRGIQKCRRRPLEPPGLFINLASIFLLTWAFGCYNLVFLMWVVNHPLLSIIFDCLTFSTPVVNFTLLYFFNQDFQACFLQVFRRSRNKYREEVPNLPEIVLENGRGGSINGSTP